MKKAFNSITLFAFLASTALAVGVISSSIPSDNAIVKDNNTEVVQAKKGNNKVTICHKGKTISVNSNAVKAHLAHGDYLGSCSGSSAMIVAHDHDHSVVNAKKGNNKVTICHKGKTISVNSNAVNAHLAHGDYLGR